jgi:hypothetical protein
MTWPGTPPHLSGDGPRLWLARDWPLPTSHHRRPVELGTSASTKSFRNDRLSVRSLVVFFELQDLLLRVHLAQMCCWSARRWRQEIAVQGPTFLHFYGTRLLLGSSKVPSSRVLLSRAESVLCLRSTPIANRNSATQGFHRFMSTCGRVQILACVRAGQRGECHLAQSPKDGAHCWGEGGARWQLGK